MHIKKLLLAALIGAVFAPAFAADMEDDQAETITVIAHDTATVDGVRLAAPLARQGKVVKGAPYSAEALSERLQNLADGNQISQRMSSMNYRDSSGRTRQEERDSKGELRSIVIHDGEGMTWILNPREKTALKIGFSREMMRAITEAGREAGRVAGEAARAKIAQLRKEGKLADTEHHGPSGDQIVVKRIERVEGENVRIRTNTALGEAGAWRELANAPAFAAFGDAKWSAKATTRELGSKEIEGVKAEGKMRSYEIPAGEVGNRNPIVVSDESWYAPELQVTVLTRHSDPRSGEQVYRLANIKRDEPAAALFTVPSDYAVKDAMNKETVSNVVNAIKKTTP